MLSVERVESTSNSRAQHVLSLLVDEAKHSQKKELICTMINLHKIDLRILPIAYVARSIFELVFYFPTSERGVM